jgi:hypothetical protein
MNNYLTECSTPVNRSTIQDTVSVITEMPSNMRNGRILGKPKEDWNTNEYDSYKKDIAVVKIFFGQSTIIQMNSKSAMGWIDYLSAVGGLLGLVLGMGIVSVVEILWLCLRVGAFRFRLTNWIA